MIVTYMKGGVPYANNRIRRRTRLLHRLSYRQEQLTHPHFVLHLPWKGGAVMFGRPLPESPMLLDWLLHF